MELKSLHGRKIAVDASMAIYQFLIAVRSGGPNQQAVMLTNAEGETTSHIQGMFNRTIRFLSEGIRPVYVFDGKPPQIKSHELVKRKEKREKAQAALISASEEGNIEEQDKQSKRLVRAGTKENEDCRRLLELMGVPVVKAPCEAEAQCAAMAKAGQVYAAATEDMDVLTFATPMALRKMTFAKDAKSLVQTVNYEKAVLGLGLTQAEFVDLCILMGCDYCDTIRGVGPKTALKLIREHHSIENIIDNIDKKKYTIPESWVKTERNESDKEESDGEQKNNMEQFVPAYVQARQLFLNHEVLENTELKWKPCQTEELTKFLVDDMGFNPERVQSSIDKLQKAYKATLKPQTRMDAFFKVAPSKRPAKKPVPSAKKGKVAKKR